MATASLPSTDDKSGSPAGGSQGSAEDQDSFDLTGHHPTRDTLAEGIVSLLSPTLKTVDEGVLATKRSQEDLAEQIALLTDQLQSIAAEQSCPIDLNGYVTRLGDIKGKINVISSVLHSAQVRQLSQTVTSMLTRNCDCDVTHSLCDDRLNRVHEQALREAARRKPLLEPAPSSTTSSNAKKPFVSSDEDSDTEQPCKKGGGGEVTAEAERTIPSPLTDPLTDSSPSS